MEDASYAAIYWSKNSETLDLSDTEESAVDQEGEKAGSSLMETQLMWTNLESDSVDVCYFWRTAQLGQSFQLLREQQVNINVLVIVSIATAYTQGRVQRLLHVIKD